MVGVFFQSYFIAMIADCFSVQRGDTRTAEYRAQDTACSLSMSKVKADVGDVAATMATIGI